jgi:adenylate kinase
MRLLILFGAPGAGKGTHAMRLSAHEDIPHISTGDLLRDEVRRKTELGQRAQQFMDAGQLVPDSLILAMLQKRLQATDCVNGALLDGFPRTIAQAEALAAMFPAADMVVLQLDVPDEVLVERLSGRLSCAQCGAVFHRSNRPPQQPGHCDLCQGTLHQRSDDLEETIRKRLQAFHSQTSPLSRFYAEHGVLHRIQADQPIDDVYRDILKALSAASPR